MAVEVIGIDHVFVTVRDLRTSEEFYDRVMGVLGFRRWEVPIGGDPHVVYYNRHFAYSLRPARENPRPRSIRTGTAPLLLSCGGRGGGGPGGRRTEDRGYRCDRAPLLSGVRPRLLRDLL
jgi:catechol 2,3-dioxygenase-like lactoylglutathione lyase family enzyme